MRDGSCSPNFANSVTAAPCGPAVCVLYTRPNSIYLKLGFDCWGIERDARTYAGPAPVIAHPPCGHWGRYRANCRLPGKDCGPLAVDQVRRFGGVLEQPASSRLLRYCGCPTEPGQRDLHGGQVLYVDQGNYGHLAAKATVLYVVGVDASPRILPPSPPRSLRLLESLSRPQRQGTPLRFALLLLAIISQVEVRP